MEARNVSLISLVKKKKKIGVKTNTWIFVLLHCVLWCKKWITNKEPFWTNSHFEHTPQEKVIPLSVCDMTGTLPEYLEENMGECSDVAKALPDI